MNQQCAALTFDKIIEYLLYIFVAFSLISIAGTQITLGLVLVVWIIKMILEQRWLIKKTSLELALLMFILTVVLATIFSIDPAASFVNLKNLLLISVVYLFVSNINDRATVVRLVNLFIGVSAIMALAGLVGTDIIGGKRVMALKSTTMTWGAMSAVFTIITVSVLLFGVRGKKQLLYALAFIIQFIAMLFSYVRGSWIGFVAGVIVLGLVKTKKLIVGILIFLLIVFLLAPPAIKNRIHSITDIEVGSTKVRFTQWRNAIKIFRDYPLTGVGWIDLGELHRSYAPEGADLNYQAYRIGHFHNNFVMFLVCFGVLGFIAGCYMIFRIVQIEYRIYRKISPHEKWLSAVVVGCIAAFIGFWTNGLFDWTFGDAEPATLIWFTIGVTVTIGNLVSCKSEKI